MEKKEVALLEKKVMPLVEQARAQKVEAPADVEKATTILSDLNRYHDSVVAAREKVTKPLNAALAAARAMFSPVEKPAKAAIDELRGRIGDYQTAEAERADAEAAKIAGRIGQGKGKLKLETASRKADEIERPEESVATEAGMLKFRTVPTLRVTDESLLPREYLVVDEKKLEAALKEGEKIPGAELFNKKIPVNIR